ncbi:MAG: hypothetical protein NZT92_22915 [Abditibacteriales bacterium]|nr:hypothetical protein [Abditibacteriales bacterium]
MKRVLLSLCLFGLFRGGPAAAQQPISPEQAKAAVRAFEEDPNLQFKGEPALGQDTEGPAWTHLSWYDLESTRGDSYRVDAHTGEVVIADYKNENLPQEPLDDPPGPRSKEDCLQIAQTFARAKYRDFDTMGLTLIESEWVNGQAWMFDFGQKGAYGALTPNGCEVEVNPVDGKILAYRAMRFGAVTPRPPQLTAAQAIEKAKQAGGIVNVTWKNEPSLRADPTGGVWWTFAFGGTDANGEYRGYAVTLNAETAQMRRSQSLLLAEGGKHLYSQVGGIHDDAERLATAAMDVVHSTSGWTGSCGALVEPPPTTPVGSQIVGECLRTLGSL